MSDKTLPKSVQQKARRCIAKITAWNQAIERARQKEIARGKPGFYEHSIRVDKKHMYMHLAASQGAHTLDLIEETLRTLGWTPQEFYTTLGTVRPTPAPEGPHVGDWFQAQR